VRDIVFDVAPEQLDRVPEDGDGGDAVHIVIAVNDDLFLPPIDRSKGTIYYAHNYRGRGTAVAPAAASVAPVAPESHSTSEDDPTGGLGNAIDAMSELLNSGSEQDKKQLQDLLFKANASAAEFTNIAARRGRSTLAGPRKGEVATAHEQWVTDQEAVYKTIADRLRAHNVPEADIQHYLTVQRMSRAVGIVGEWTQHKIDLSGGNKENGQCTKEYPCADHCHLLDVADKS